MNVKESLVQLIASTDELHKRFDIPMSNLTKLELNDRLRIQMEEVGELAKAVSYDDKEEILSESVDIAVIAIGTLLLVGDRIVPAIEKVINKNNSKTNKTHNFKGGKIIRINR